MQVIQDAATTNISMLIRYIVQIIGSLTIMLALSWKLTLVMLSVVPAIAMGAVRYGKKIKEIRTDFQARTAVRLHACVGRYRRALHTRSGCRMRSRSRRPTQRKRFPTSAQSAHSARRRRCIGSIRKRCGSR